MANRILVVGGVAGGASTAARVRRLDPKAEIIMFEKGPHTSFSNCSLPFYLSDVVESADALVEMTPQKFKDEYNIDARVRHEVLSIDRDKKEIRVKDLEKNEEYTEKYDKLVLSPGASPVRPRPIPGIMNENVFTVRNVEDIVRIETYIRENNVNDICVIGGGFIGLEVAENLRLAGKNVSIAEMADQVMMPIDYDMVQILHKEIMDHGVDLNVGDGLKEITDDGVILNSGKEIKCGAVILSIGVRAETQLAQEAGLEIGETGGIKVNHNYQTNDPDIYAVGDAIEVTHFITNQKTRLTLAGPAQRQARAAADSMYDRPTTNTGVIGSSVVQVFDMNAACTGLNEKAVQKLGWDYRIAVVIPYDKVKLMPDAEPLAFKLVFAYPSGKVLGAQAIGRGNVDKRIDVIATAIKLGATVQDLADLELCYSPMFGTAKDVVNMAALVALNVLNEEMESVPFYKVRELAEAGATIIDVREPNEYENSRIEGAVNIPLSQFRERLDEIPKDKPVYLHCISGQRSYYVTRELANLGYDNVLNIQGAILGASLYEFFNDKREGRKPVLTNYKLDLLMN